MKQSLPRTQAPPPARWLSVTARSKKADRTDPFRPAKHTHRQVPFAAGKLRPTCRLALLGRHGRAATGR